MKRLQLPLLALVLCASASVASAERQVRLDHDATWFSFADAGLGLDVATLQQLEFAFEYDPDLIEITELVAVGILATNPPDRLDVVYLPGRVEVSLGYDEPLALGPEHSSDKTLFTVSRNLLDEFYWGEHVSVRTVGLTPGVPPSWIDSFANPDDVKTVTEDLHFIGEGRTCLAGDALGDGKIDAGDSGTVLRIVTDLIEAPGVAVRCGSDFNQDGYVYAGDGVLILRRAAGFDDFAPRVEVDPEIRIAATGSGARVRIDRAAFAHGATLRVRSVGALAFRNVTTNSVALAAARVADDEAVIALADVAPLTDDVLEFDIEAEGVGRIVIDQLSLYGAGGDALFEQDEPLSLEVTGPPVVSRVALSNSPNPFNPSTTFVMQMPQEGRVVLELFDVRGRKLATLLDEVRPAGRSEHRFDGEGMAMSSGVYFAKMSTAAGETTRRVTLLK